MIQLRIDRTLPATPPRVWPAFTDPAALAAWFWPAEYDTSVDLDARPGGVFRVSAPDAPGGGLALAGTFRAVRPPHHLALTWRWDGDDEQTLVTIDLTGVGDGTALVLTQEGFDSEASRDNHVTGWTDCLDRLPTWLASTSAH